MSARAWPLFALLLLQPLINAALAAVRPASLVSDRGTSARTERYRSGRALAAQLLIARGDAESLAAAAALSFFGPARGTRTDFAADHIAAIELAAEASDRDPENAAIAWLRLELSASTAGYDIRDAATTMRWVDADNAAAWLASLAAAERERNATEIDRILAAMAQGARFDLYWNRTVVLLYDALKRIAEGLPRSYVASDAERFSEASSVASAEVLPSLQPLLGACVREPGALERRESCSRIARIMQRSDAVIAQLAGLSIEKHWAAPDGRDARAVAERRRTLEWRVATASQADEPLLPWMKSAQARHRIATMRALPREEDVDVAILRQHRLPLEPP